jgi:hypothetical protein
MITSFSLRNFKAHRSLDLSLSPLTVLVGPNASGKTSVLEGLHLLAQLGGLQPGALFRWARDLARLRTRDVHSPVRLAWRGLWRGTEGSAALDAEPLVEPPQPDSTLWKFQASGTWGEQSLDPQVTVSSFGELHRALGAAMRSAVLLRLDARKLGEPSYSEEELPRVEYDGTGLPSVLAHLKLTDEEVFSAIQDNLRKIVPSVERIRIDRASIRRIEDDVIKIDDQPIARPKPRTYWGHQILFDMKGAAMVPPEAAGEGTVLALGLLAVLMGPRRARLILLDDIELALHPAAQEQLVGVLREIMQGNSERQVVATSHSPFILDYLRPEEVRMTALAPDGSARCGNLTDHPEYARWKDMMRPGEFWSTVGEQWLVAGESNHG